MSEDKNRSRQAAEAPRGPSTFKFDPDQLVIIGVDTEDGPEHPLYDPRAFRELKPEKKAMYRRLGVRVPVKFKHMKVKLRGAKEFTDADVVIDGKGRTLYARAIKRDMEAAGADPADFIKVPGLSERGSDEDLFGISRALNQHEADGPLENAKSVQRMISYGKSEEECAETMGVSGQTIRNWLSLLELDPAVQQEMGAALTPTAALALAQLPRAEQKEVLAEVKQEAAEGTKATVESVRRKVAEKSGKEHNPNTPKAKLERLEKILFKLSGQASPKKEDLEKAIDQMCRVVTGHTLEKLGDIGD